MFAFRPRAWTGYATTYSYNVLERTATCRTSPCALAGWRVETHRQQRIRVTGAIEETESSGEEGEDSDAALLAWLPTV